MGAENRDVKLQVMVDAKLAAKIDELAERVGISRSAFLAVLVEEAIDDNEWIIRLVTSRFVEPIRKAYLRWAKDKKDGPSKGRTASE